MYPTMDSRLRENGFNPSSSSSSSLQFPPPSNDSYFTEQAFRAGLMRNDEMRRAEFPRNLDPVREAIVIELEKERIIQEIMAAEINRKRAFEAELRREIAMGRDLAVQREMEFSWTPLMLAEPRGPFLHHHLRHDPNDSRFSFPSGQEVGITDRFSFQQHSEGSQRPIGNFTFSEFARGRNR